MLPSGGEFGRGASPATVKISLTVAVRTRNEKRRENLRYAEAQSLPRIKVIFVNDGPGILLGSMWNDYAYIEEQWPGRVKVVTLRMVHHRITPEWLRS